MIREKVLKKETPLFVGRGATGYLNPFPIKHLENPAKSQSDQPLVL